MSVGAEFVHSAASSRSAMVRRENLLEMLEQVRFEIGRRSGDVGMRATQRFRNDFIHELEPK